VVSPGCESNRASADSPQGYAAVPAGDSVKIVPKEEAAKRSLQVRIGSDPEQIPLVDSIATQIMPLKYADAEEVSRIKIGQNLVDKSEVGLDNSRPVWYIPHRVPILIPKQRN